MATTQIAPSIGNTTGIRTAVNNFNRPKMQIAISASFAVGANGQVFPTGR